MGIKNGNMKPWEWGIGNGNRIGEKGTGNGNGEWKRGTGNGNRE